LGLPDTDAIADFIASKYEDARKIVEVMVGYNPWIAKALKRRLPRTEIVVVDRFQEKVYYVSQKDPKLTGIVDDILKPDLEIYRGASLIYAIRPPEEYLLHIYDLAEKISADILIRPLSDVDGDFYYPLRDGWQKISYKRSSFRLLRRGEQLEDREKETSRLEAKG